MSRMSLIALVLLMAAAPLSAQYIEARGERDRRGLKLLKNRFSRRVISVDWSDDVTLREALRDLRTRTGLHLVLGTPLHRGELAEEPVDLKLRNIAVWDLLKVLADRHELGLRMRGRLLVVSTRADTIRRSMRLVIHDVRLVGYRPQDFPGPRLGLRVSGVEDEFTESELPDRDDPESIVELVRRLTGEEKWEVEGASLDLIGGRLIVRHAPSMQREVRRVLALMRH